MKVNTKEAGWGVLDWIDLTRDRGRWRRVVNAVMNIRDP